MEIFEGFDNHVLKFGKFNIDVMFDGNGVLWFAAKQVAKALGYSDKKQALKNHVDKEEIDHIKNLDIEYEPSIIHSNTLFMNEYGLYSLIMKSKKPEAKAFTKWIRYDVLPSIRKYGTYKMKKECENDKSQLMRDLRLLQKQNQICQNDLKKECYPDGGMVYGIDYSDQHDEEVFRIGMTDNMNQREKIYKTHTLHNRKVVDSRITDDPKQFEMCLRSMLRHKRYRDNKDYYVCSLSYLKKAFTNCEMAIKKMKTNGQTGGGINYIENQIINDQKKIGILERKIERYEKILKQK